MKKTFIKKIFSFNKSKEQKIEQVSTPYENDKADENKDKSEITKNDLSSIDRKNKGTNRKSKYSICKI